MDVANKIQEKLKKILEKLKRLGIIQAFKLEINFCHIEKALKRSLIEIDSVLKKCLKKIVSKPKKAELRNIISELVRKKNLNDNVSIAQEPVTGNLLDKKSFSAEWMVSDNGSTAAVVTFQCGFCNETFDSKKSLTVHKKVHKYSDIFLCDKCGKIFYNFKKWQQHAEENNEQSLVMKNFTVDFESEILTSENGDEVHMKNITFESFAKEPSTGKKLRNSNLECKSENQVATKGEQKFICTCGKIFNILKTFRKHEKLKHSLDNKKHNCVTCGKSFLEKGKLNRHMLSHKKSQYQCSFCSKQFSRSDTLKRHTSLFHCASREFLCSFCQKKFKLKFNRDVHEENIHKNVDNWVQCQHCEQKFRNKITLKSHLKIHSGNRITCTSCSKSFSRKSYFKSHVQNKHSGSITN